MTAAASVRDVARTALQGALDDYLCHEPALRLALEPEAVHQTRVAIRRMRSHLRTFRDFLDSERTAALDDRMHALGERLGAVRDADVLMQRLQRDVAQLPAVAPQHVNAVYEPAQASRAKSREELAEALAAPGYQALVEAMTAAARIPPATTQAEHPARGEACAVMRPVWRRLRNRLRRIPAPEELHQIRIRVKHVRYAAEAFEPLYGRAARRIARRAAALQAALGDMHDAAAAVAHLRGHAESPAGAFLAGEICVLEQRCVECELERWRPCWRRLREAGRFWR